MNQRAEYFTILAGLCAGDKNTPYIAEVVQDAYQIWAAGDRVYKDAQTAAMRQHLDSDPIEAAWQTGYMAGHASRDGEFAELRQQLAAKQAEVDALMLEYCPSEMSQEQLDNWAAHQRPAKEK